MDQEDYVEVFRHVQPFEVKKVLIALRNEGISCNMWVAGPWGKSPVHNPGDYHSVPSASFYVLVREDQFPEARAIVSNLLRGGIPAPIRGRKKADPGFTRLRGVYAIIVLLFTASLIFLTFWNLLRR